MAKRRRKSETVARTIERSGAPVVIAAMISRSWKSGLVRFDDVGECRDCCGIGTVVSTRLRR
jgi:hypothetical protein